MAGEPRPNSTRPGRLVAIGASAGGVNAIIDLVGALPKDLNASVLVVLHLSPTAHSALPDIVARRTGLSVSAASDGQPLLPGHVYVAPPDLHLQVDRSHVRVLRGPWENGHRPAVDTLFRSAARWWAHRAIGVVLTGALDDGAAGLVAIHRAGGVALVQDPREADVPDMPLAAIETGVVDASLDLAQLAKLIVELSASTPVGDTFDVDETALPAGLVVETEQDAREVGTERPLPRGAPPAGLVCPDCGGSLFELDDDPLHLRCRVGHGWTAEALHAANYRGIEEAIWTAVRVLEEDVALQQRMASRARAKAHHHALARIEQRLAERARLLEVLRTSIAKRPPESELGFEGSVPLVLRADKDDN